MFEVATANVVARHVFQASGLRHAFIVFATVNAKDVVGDEWWMLAAVTFFSPWHSLDRQIRSEYWSFDAYLKQIVIRD